MSWIEIIAVIFALLYVVLAIYENRNCWLAAIISAALYIKIFYAAALYSDAALQFFFIALSIKGYFTWQPSKQFNLVISNLSISKHLPALLLSMLCSFILGWLTHNYLKADYAYSDAAIACFSIYTTWLASNKIIESWLYWIAIDIFAAYVYFMKDLLATSLLFLLYVVLAFYGYLQWKKTIRNYKLTQVA